MKTYTSGNEAIVDILSQSGIFQYVGVTGGGVIHVAKEMTPHSFTEKNISPNLLTINEYIAGFSPLGYYLATGKISACLATTGAATKLSICGLSDAKFHNIPAIYLIALNSTPSIGKSPLQDVSHHGINLIPQLEAELGEDCIVIDNIQELSFKMEKVFSILKKSKPVAILFRPDVLCLPITLDVPKPQTSHFAFCKEDMEAFLLNFPKHIEGRRVVIFVSSEATRSNDICRLTTELSRLLKAPTVWSVNGANAVARENEFGYGYISFGGNEAALNLWENLSSEDVVLALGFDPEEYVLNLKELNVKHFWNLTNIESPYGAMDGGFSHRIKGHYHTLHGDIGTSLNEIIKQLKTISCSVPADIAPPDLNEKKSKKTIKEGCVDLVAFYKKIDTMWQPHSVGFDDVCMAYKDRQYICQRPNKNIRFFAATAGSAMGGAFGMGIGAKLADPNLNTFIFSGDGCFRLFGGALADVAHLGLRLFILNNSSYAIVEQGLNYILPDVEKSRYHGSIPTIDFVKIAESHGWQPYQVNSDLSNLEEIMSICYSKTKQSILIDVPVDAKQEIGINPRVRNLTAKCYL